MCPSGEGIASLFFSLHSVLSRRPCVSVQYEGRILSRLCFVPSRWPHGRSHPTRRDRKKGAVLLDESPRYNMGRFTPIFALYLNIKCFLFFLRPSSLVLRLSSFVLRPSSFVLRPSSFVSRPSSSLSRTASRTGVRGVQFFL